MSLIHRLRRVVLLLGGIAAAFVCPANSAICASTFPLGIYCVGLESFSEIRDAKFNVVLNPFWAQGKESSLRYLETCQRYGKKGTPGFDTQKIRGGDVRYLRDYVQALKGHPALYAYYLSDEPSTVGVTPDAATFAYQAIKSVDASRPVLVSHFRDAKAYLGAYDVLCYDQYPIGGMTIARYRQIFRDVVSQVNPKPVWTVVQAFGAGKEWKRPTPQEERCMTYLTVANGAQGILFYMYGRPGDSYYIRENPDHWDCTRRLAAELDQLSAMLLAKASTLRAAAENKYIDVLLKEVEGRLYMIAVNWAAGSFPLDGHYPGIPLAGARIALPGLESAAVKVVGQAGSGSAAEGRELKVADGYLVDSFDPYAVHIYEIRPLRSK
jgi:hypothetical protein